MGVADPVPGIGADQARFSLASVAGRFFSVVVPLKCGPRHCGQFSAGQVPAERVRRIVGMIRRMVLRIVRFTLYIAGLGRFGRTACNRFNPPDAKRMRGSATGVAPVVPIGVGKMNDLAGDDTFGR
jgi:hypothetical protein